MSQLSRPISYTQVDGLGTLVSLAQCPKFGLFLFAFHSLFLSRAIVDLDISQRSLSFRSFPSTLIEKVPILQIDLEDARTTHSHIIGQRLEITH
jgi:hypothetical protein